MIARLGATMSGNDRMLPGLEGMQSIEKIFWVAIVFLAILYSDLIESKQRTQLALFYFITSNGNGNYDTSPLNLVNNDLSIKEMDCPMNVQDTSSEWLADGRHLSPCPDDPSSTSLASANKVAFPLTQISVPVHNWHGYEMLYAVQAALTAHLEQRSINELNSFI